MKVRGRRTSYSLALAFLFALSSKGLHAAQAYVSSDQRDPGHLADRVEIVGVEQLGNDTGALIGGFTITNNVCLTYDYDDSETLSYRVRLALIDDANNDNDIVDLPIINVVNGSPSGVDPGCPPAPPPPNVPPIAEDDDNWGSNYAGQNVLVNDRDPDNGPGPLTAVPGSFQTAGNGAVQLNADGSFVYTPAPGFSGQDSFTYRAFDGQDQSDPATVLLTVPAPGPNPPGPNPPEPNEPPVASNFTLEEPPYQGNVLDYVTDADSPREALSATLVTPLQELQENGEFFWSATGEFNFIPDEDFAGTITFQYKASDGIDDSNTATGTIIVAEDRDDPPTANPVSAEAVVDSGRVTGQVDVDHDEPWTVAMTSEPSNGQATLTPDGRFTYTPDEGFTGTDSFNYRAFDGEQYSNTATVTITITEEEPPPSSQLEAVEDNWGTAYDGKNVLTNDNYSGDKSNLRTVLKEGTDKGDLTLNEDGSFVYKPFSSPEAQTDSFTYEVQEIVPADGEEPLSSTASVSLTIDPEAQSEDGLTEKEDPDGYRVDEHATDNELEVAERIDEICPRLDDVASTPGEVDLLALCRNLNKNGTTARQVVTALTGITPEELSASKKTVQDMNQTRMRNLGARIARVRGGSRGISIAGLNVSYEGTEVPGKALDAMFQEAVNTVGGGASADEASDFGNLGIFIRGDLNFGDQDRTDAEAGFDFDAQAITLGADYRFSDNIFAGISYSYGDAEVEFDDDGGFTDTTSHALALYGSYYSEGGAYVDGIFSYGWADIDSERNIVYEDFSGEVDRTASGSTDGTEYYLSVNAGYGFQNGGFNFDPLLRFFYLKAEIDDYKESGAGGWDLFMLDQDFESLNLTASGQVSYTFLPSWGVITPYLRIEYTREFEDSAKGIRFRFANDPFVQGTEGGTMRVLPNDPDSNYFVYGAGVATQFKYGLSGFLSYQQLGSYDNFNSASVSFGLRWEVLF